MQSKTENHTMRVFYLLAIPLAFVDVWIACAFYVLVAFIWFIPDQRIENVMGTRG